MEYVSPVRLVESIQSKSKYNSLSVNFTFGTFASTNHFLQSARVIQDKILTVFDRIAPLSKHGEPVRALFCTYVFGGALVLIGEVNAVAPLLTMCFLVAYTFMNFSCFVLTYVRSPGFRPAGQVRSPLNME